MEWTDQGIVLSCRPFGESRDIVMAMTREHGRHAGLAAGQRRGHRLQPGTRAQLTWRARLAEHLGHLVVDVAESPAAAVLDDPDRLAALASACALVEAAVPERAPYPHVFDGLETLLGLLEQPFWDAVYVGWEVQVLAALGFGLDLTRCAATGANDDLAYVSPRTGRAVALSAAEPYRERLLPLPGFLIGRGEAGPAEVADGLALTGHFLERLLFGQGHKAVPPARGRLVERCKRRAGRVGPTDQDQVS
ncbi:MAG: DNA repair protein RecO [Rhodospirillaceae bacterium]|nr:DNA repair protein RecO [Rhodospirillaceae bacterium]